MIKLVASDVDGTILKPNDIELKASLFDMIEKLYNKGILFVAASGRPYCELRHLFAPVCDKMGFVCNDGALTLIGDRIVDIRCIESSKAKEILHDIDTYKKCEVLAYSVNEAYSCPKTESFKKRIRELLYGNEILVSDISTFNTNILKIGVFNEDGIQFVENYFLDKYSDEFEVNYAGDQWLEFNAKGIDKSVGIEALARELSISMEDTMAFGDSYNDLDMFKSVKYSYAMETAKEIVKATGKYICKDVEETIRKLLL